jgi:hypothetical protein
LSRNTRSLAKVKRALLGAAVLRGKVDLKPTRKAVAGMVGCSVSYLNAAVKLTPAEEQKVAAGLRPLIEAKEMKSPPVPDLPEEISDEALRAIVQRAGVGRVWDVIAGLVT